MIETIGVGVALIVGLIAGLLVLGVVVTIGVGLLGTALEGLIIVFKILSAIRGFFTGLKEGLAGDAVEEE